MASPRDNRSEAYVQGALQVSQQITKSLGIYKDFKKAFDDGEVPLADIAPLPTYAANDPRAGVPELMARLHLYLEVIDGLSGVIDSQMPHKKGQIAGRDIPVVQWVSDRAQSLTEAAKMYVFPAISEGLLKEKEDIIKEASTAIKLCLFAEESALATEAAQYAIERNPGVIVFLAIFPNIPFLVPTIEIRLLVTKPLLAFARAAHRTLGKIPILGFFVLLMLDFAYILDEIPRLQVRFVQSIVTRGWLRNPAQRSRLITEYLKATARHVRNLRLGTLQRALLSLVS